MSEKISDLSRRNIIAAIASAAALRGVGVDAAARAARTYRIGILETLPAAQNRANFSALLTSGPGLRVIDADAALFIERHKCLLLIARFGRANGRIVVC
jgi:hypothetical protein